MLSQDTSYHHDTRMVLLPKESVKESPAKLFTTLTRSKGYGDAKKQ